MTTPPEIYHLVERFEYNLPDYKRGKYNETQVRLEFIDPLFKALGWDIHNEKGYAEAYKDVVHEDAIKVGKATKAPDYSFRIGGTRKFFLEAKKPSVDIKHDTHPAYQLRRYAWSAKLPLSILTDFEEFAVYDGRIKPDQGDKAPAARIMYLTYKDYIDRWPDLVNIFSPEAIRKGAFDKFVETTKARKGTVEVDEAFLQEIERWRDALARNLALRNTLTQRQLNFAVQLTIDRIIFLRIAEDRGIEPYGQLRDLQKVSNVYENLFRLFQQADDRYNSGLFHFRSEKGRDNPDNLTPELKLDDKVLKEIFKNLYYPDSPYEFSVLSADILGQVYEQFLGKVIRLTGKGRAIIEDKPEVKKAGGVYYTPTYIVDYIVKETVGKLVEGKTPDDIGGKNPLRVADPACGSGSFLLGAYQFLLDWYLNWYSNNEPEKLLKKRKPPIYPGPTTDPGAPNWKLTIDERKRILLTHIYGVDIDPQAVEVTKLSLLLKVLEGEDEQSVARQLTLAGFGERVLPDLAANIKCGNSLIGPDFYDSQPAQMGLFDEDNMYRINAFDWRTEFPNILKAGGFDVVIGNPPYVRPHNLDPQVKEYFWQHYSTFVKKSDLYCCFIEKATHILKDGGFFGYIVSNGWLRLDSFEKLRIFLLDRTSLHKIIDFTGNVFEQATVKTAIILFTKGCSPDQKVKVAVTEVTPDLTKLSFKTIQQNTFRETYKSIFDLSIDESQELIKSKMWTVSTRLSDNFDLSFGLKTGDDSKFLTHSPKTSEHKPLLRGADIQRYSYTFKGEYVWYVPGQMTAHRKTARPGNAQRFEQPKVLIRDTGGDLFGTFDEENYYVKDVIVISDRSKNASKLKFLTGVLNSKLMKFFYETSFPTLHVQRNELAALPIRTLDPANTIDLARQNKLIALVEQMLDLHKQLAEAKMPQQKTMLQRQIEMTDRQIDKLVYDLYGLTDDEIKIVEGQA